MDRHPDYAAIFPRTPARNAMMRTEETLTPASPSTSELVSYRNPDGLISSTGDLYFTYHDATTASVWRAAQSALPGQEIQLYSEPCARFGDIIFAQVDGTFWEYFFSTNGGATATIKRVPLTGSGHCPHHGHRRRRSQQPS
jgi:hypothetical protein